MASVTESASPYAQLDQMEIREILQVINEEDQTVPHAVARALPQIEALVAKIVSQMQLGGRLFYIGAGTSGRLGIVDASECPPTYGVPHGMVIGIIAGGDSAIRNAVEHAEDNWNGAETDLSGHQIQKEDVAIGIAASGQTPYVAGGLKWCQSQGITTGCIVCNSGSLVASFADFPVEIIVGPEVITGSTRMKAGTAQKLALNLISTTTMIKLGKVRGNRMTHMQLTNNKLKDRAVKMVMEMSQTDEELAGQLLKKWGSVEAVLKHLESQ